MSQIFQYIIDLKDLPQLSKHEQLVNGIVNAIDSKILVKGALLPSVNMMVSELGFARKTIFKAYTELKERGIIESKNRLGYYVANDYTQQTLKIALILYAFHSFQEKFYNTFRNELGENIQLDIFFHHNNLEVLESIVSNVITKYGMYIIAPIASRRTKEILKAIPSEKLLIVDRHLEVSSDVSFISQKFKEPMYQALVSLKDALKVYKKFVLFYKEKTDYPSGIFRAFRDYMEEQKWQYEIIRSYIPESLKKGTVYFTINDNDLWEILKDCQQQKIIIGKDIGILSQNESTIKKIICGGISTFSTDFKEMARKAAIFVKTKEPIKEIIPSVLIRRPSL